MQMLASVIWNLHEIFWRKSADEGRCRIMCVGIVGTIIKMNQYSATIDMHGVRRDVSVDLLENPSPGEQVMVHAGVAIAKVQETEEVPDQGKNE